jgi:hypothetical protein
VRSINRSSGAVFATTVTPAVTVGHPTISISVSGSNPLYISVTKTRQYILHTVVYELEKAYVVCALWRCLARESDPIRTINSSSIVGINVHGK